VKAIQTPPKCKACVAEALNVIRNGPQWEPAIQNNEPVIYRQKQSITFKVMEAPEKGRKN
jgi:periplasmic protein TonB